MSCRNAPEIFTSCHEREAFTPKKTRGLGITAVPTQAGLLYVAVLLDLYSRRVIGRAINAKPDQQLTLEALAMAVRQRRIQPGLIHHTDRGAPYGALAYQRQ